MPLFNVTIEGVIVVDAPDEDSALDRARREIDGIGDFANELAAVHACPVRSEADLHGGWSHDCYPFGGSGILTIGEILSR